jgi:hypothetical protein
MSLVDKVIQRLSSHKDYEEAIKTIRKNSYGQVYLVGGKIYRTVSEIVHGIECGAKDADWDALCMGEVKVTYCPPGWGSMPPKLPNSMALAKRVGNGYAVSFGAYNRRRRYVPPGKQHKIDLIGIKDVPGDGTLQSYFDIVPLDIQRMALDLEGRALHGTRAMDAIRRKMVKVNNSEGCLPGLQIKPYIARKAQSLGFTYEGQVIAKVDCNCYGGDSKALWDYGCKLPQFHR